MLTILGLMIFYVWMRIKIHDTLSENLSLDAELRRLRVGNQELQADVVRLSEFGRITRVAQEKLGMVVIQGKDVKEIQK